LTWHTIVFFTNYRENIKKHENFLGRVTRAKENLREYKFSLIYSQKQCPLTMSDIEANNHPNEETVKHPSCVHRYRLWILLAVVLVLGGGIALGVYYATRPEFIPVQDTQIEETLPSLVQVAPITDDSAVLLQYTEPLNVENVDQDFYYYVTLQDFEADATNVDLFLTSKANPSLEDLNMPHIKISNVNNQEQFPYRLPVEFLPGDYPGVLFVKNSNEVLESTSFSIIVDEEQSNMRSPTVPPAPSPTQMPDENAPPSTASPTQTTVAPPSMAPPPAPPLPPILVSSLESFDYNIEGTLTIDYSFVFSGGELSSQPRLTLDLPVAASAPGPFLYLSPRPYSETRGTRRLTDEDIYIPVDETPDGSFTIQGEFQQILDELGSAQDVEKYTQGSWIVWCRPFRVWLGGGPIEIKS